MSEIETIKQRKSTTSKVGSLKRHLNVIDIEHNW